MNKLKQTQKKEMIVHMKKNKKISSQTIKMNITHINFEIKRQKNEKMKL